MFIKYFGSNTSPYIILVIAVLISMIISQVLSNNATILIMLHPILAVTNGLGYNPLPFTLVVIYSASFAFRLLSKITTTHDFKNHDMMNI
jgi:di/tricarboxylate transporter